MSRKFIYGVLGFLLVGFGLLAILLSYFTQLSDTASVLIALLGGIAGALLGIKTASGLNKMAPRGESNTSLQWWFIILGAFGIYSIFMNPSGQIEAPALSLSIIVSIIFSCITLYIGLAYKSLMPKHIKLIINFLYLEIAYSIITTAILMFSGQANSSSMTFGLVAAILLQLYIIRSVQKLSGSAQT